jgi:hypothetical protein
VGGIPHTQHSQRKSGGFEDEYFAGREVGDFGTERGTVVLRLASRMLCCEGVPMEC